MAKRGKKKKKTTNKRNLPLRRTPSAAVLEESLAQAADLLSKEKSSQAIEILEPLAEAAPREPDVWEMLGAAYSMEGIYWEALIAYRQALDLAPRRPDLWLDLLFVYLNLSFYVLAWKMLQKILRSGALPLMPPGVDMEEIRDILNEELEDLAAILRQPRAKLEQGLYAAEEAHIAMYEENYQRSIALAKRAIRILPNYPPVRNNLALVLFFLGRWQEAIATEREVLAQMPDDVQALGNLVRFFRWTGQDEEASKTWQRLKTFKTKETDLILKQVIAATIMEDDEAVYRLLRRLQRRGELAKEPPWPWGFYLAVAKANLGKRQAALKHVEPLRSMYPRAEKLWHALKQGKRGLGFTGRFHYTDWMAPLPQPFTDLLQRIRSLSKDEEGLLYLTAKDQQKLQQMTAQYPQVLIALRKLLWEEGDIQAALDFADLLDVPEAYQILEEFALGQAGDDDSRMEVLLGLHRSGYLPAGKTMRFWGDGQWREVELRLTTIKDEWGFPAYDEKTNHLLEQATRAQVEGQNEKAEQLYRRLLEINPKMKEAYHNLGVIHLIREEEEKAEEMLRRALEIDPHYVLARLNLAVILLDRGEIEETKALIEPISDLSTYNRTEAKTLAYVNARLAMGEKHFTKARKYIEAALDLDPDNPQFQALKDTLTFYKAMEHAKDSLSRFLHKRRERRRKRLGTRHPTLTQALQTYNREHLIGIGKSIDPDTRWYPLRKAELVAEISARLQDPSTLAFIVAELGVEERRALQQVLSADGALAWEAFAQAFDDDWSEGESWGIAHSESIMGRLRALGVLVESEDKEGVWLSVPQELRAPLGALLEALEDS